MIQTQSDEEVRLLWSTGWQSATGTTVILTSVTEYCKYYLVLLVANDHFINQWWSVISPMNISGCYYNTRRVIECFKHWLGQQPDMFCLQLTGLIRVGSTDWPIISVANILYIHLQLWRQYQTYYTGGLSPFWQLWLKNSTNERK